MTLKNEYILKRLKEDSKEKVLEHFLRLDSQSIYNRFCGNASIETITRYVNRINFEDAGIFGVFNTDLDIIGLGECVVDRKNNIAEVGFSVEEKHRGQGLANKIMARIVRFSKSQNNAKLEMFCLRNNQQSIAIAKKFGLTVFTDATECSAKIDLENNIPAIEELNEKVEDAFSGIAIEQQKTFNRVKLGQKLFITTLGMLSQINPFIHENQNKHKKQMSS